MKSFPRFLQQSLYLLSFCASKAVAAAKYQHGRQADGPATACCLTQSLCCGNFEGLGDSDREFTNNEPSYTEQALVLYGTRRSSLPGRLVGKFI